MALDLVARISLKDDLSGRLGRISKSVSGLGRTFNDQAKQLSGMRTQILGIAGAYVSARGAAKAFNATLGEAAKYEASKVAIEAIFNDKSLSDSYLKVVDKMAIDSPLLNSKEMMSSSKGLIAMTKNVDDLGKSWGIIEKLMVLDPTQGTEGAAFALKEMFQGDSLSMVERFGLNKKELNRIKKLDIPQQLAEITNILDGMGVTEDAVNKMGKTTLGYWAQIQERADKFMTSIGSMGNSKIGEVLGGVVAALDNFDTTALAAKVDAIIGNGIQKVIDFGKRVWELRSPILEVAKVVGTFVGTVAAIVGITSIITGIGTAIAFLGSPIGLLAVGILGVSKAFKVAYEKIEPFRKAVDTVVGIVSSLFADLSGNKAQSMDLMTKFGLNSDTIKAVFGFSNKVKDAMGRVSNAFTALTGGDGVGVLQALGFSPEMIAKVTGVVEVIKAKVTEFVAYLASKWVAIQPGIATLMQTFTMFKDNLVNIFTTLWSLVQPVISALVAAFRIVADVVVIAFNNVIAPVLRNTMAVMQMLWKIVGPILSLLGAAIGIAFEILRVVWDTIIKPFVNFMTTAFKKGLELAIPIIEKVGGAFDVIGGVISKVADWLNDFTSALSRFKVPNWLSKLGGGGTVKFEESSSSGQKNSHYNGIDYVPHNGYQATLHKGESVVTAQENRERKNGGGGVNIAKLADQIVIREEADIEKFAMELARMIEREGYQMS